MKKGLTLIEAGIATVVFTLVLLSMLSIFGQGNLYLRKSRLRIVGYNAARGIVEQYFNWTGGSYSLDGLSGAAGVVDQAYSNPPNAVTVNSVSYAPTLTVDSAPCVTNQPGAQCTGGPPLSNSELKQVDVTVTWSGGSFTITTLKANY